jgi:hypothetical protein
MIATAAKAERGQSGINVRIHWLAGIQKQGGGLLVVQIAAWMWLSGVELEMGQLGHESALAEP